MTASPGAFGAAARIVADVVVYRVRKREMGNLVTSTTLAAALALPLGDVALRFAFGALLNLWVYLVNDLIDVDVDLAAPGRDQTRVRFLSDHRRIGWLTSMVLLAALAGAGAAHSPGLLVAVSSTAVIIVAYTRWWKRTPGLDLLAMAGWGLSMALVGCPLESAAGLRLAGLLALLCASTEAVQVLRDEDSDRAAGVRTTAVVLGPRLTVLCFRVLVLASAVYASLLLHRWLGLLLLLALPVPMAPGDAAARRWDIFRALFGITWLALLSAYFLGGRLDGFLS